MGLDVESEITNSINAGNIVTAHETPVSFVGGTNVGYLLIDPLTGAGAYKIAGGANGGFLSSDAASILGFLGFALGVIGAGFSVPLLVVISAVIAIIIAISLILDYLAINHRCTGLGYLIGLSVLATLAGVFSGGILAVVIMYTGLIAGGGAMSAANSSICKN